MNGHVERRAVPTLMGGQRRQIQPGYGHVQSLLDLLHEGFYLLFMLKNGCAPPGEEGRPLPPLGLAGDLARRDAHS